MSKIKSFFGAPDENPSEKRAEYLSQLQSEQYISKEEHDWAINNPEKQLFPVRIKGPTDKNPTKIWIRDCTTDLVIVGQLFSGDEYGLERIKKINPNVKTIVDIGGHIGSFSRRAKNMFPAAMLYSFEPFEENYEMLQRNTKDLGGVCIENCAIGGSRYASEFKICANHGTNNSGGTQIVWSDNKEDGSIPQISLSEVFDKYNLDTIDILKLDCEGSEYDIIPEAYKSGLLDKVRYMALEYHVSPEKGRHFHEIFKYLDKFKYINFTKTNGSSGIMHCLNY